MPSLIFCLFSRLNDNGDHRQYPVKGRQVNGHPDRLRAQVAPGKEHPKADIAGQNGWGKLEAEGRVEQAGTQDAQVGHALLLGPEPIVEQEAIASFLDNKCASIERVIDGRSLVISNLTAYKKSLIYEAVTGKTEV